MITIFSDTSLPVKFEAYLRKVLTEDIKVIKVGYDVKPIESYSEYEKVVFAMKIDTDKFGYVNKFKNGHKYVVSMPMSKLSSTSYELLTIFVRHCMMLTGQVHQLKMKEVKNIIVKSIKDFDAMMENIKASEVIAIDIETNNLNYLDNKIISIQFAVADDLAYFLPLYHSESPFSAKELEYVEKKLRHYFECGKSKFHIYHNAIFDVGRFFSLLKCRWYNHRIFDTMSAMYAIDENRKNYHFFKHGAYSLKTLCQEYGIGHIYEEGSLGKEDRVDLEHKTLEDIAEYGYKDVVSIYMIARAMIKENGKRFAKYVVDQLGRTNLAIAILQKNGLGIDKELCASYNSESGYFATKLADMQKQLCQFDSVKHVLAKKVGFFKTIDLGKADDRKALFVDELHLDVDVSAKGNMQFGTSFKKAHKDVPEIALYKQIEELKHLRSTYITGIYERLSNPDTMLDSRVHASYGYLRVVTGRLSSFDPNYQNIPSGRKAAELVDKIRSQFVPNKGSIFVKADYSAHEIRMWGNLSGDAGVAEGFNHGTDLMRKVRIGEALGKDVHELIEKMETEGDVHKVNFKRIYGRWPVDKRERGSVKSLCFGLIYGRGIPSIAEQLGEKPVMTREEASAELRSEGFSEKPWSERLQAKMYPNTTKVVNDFAATFQRGFDFIPNNNKQGREVQVLEAPNGHIRHLNGYFLDMTPSKFNHDVKVEPLAYSRSDRQATNSLIQGFASEVGCMAGYLLNKLMWYLEKNGVHTGFMYDNVVHDSVETEVKFEHAPAVMYAIESAYTNLVSREYEKLFDFKMIADLSVELDIGAAYTVDKLYTWDWSEANLIEHMNKIAEDAKDRFEVTEAMKKKFMKNWKIVKKWRLLEMKEAVKLKKEGLKTAYVGTHWKECFDEYIEANKKNDK